MLYFHVMVGSDDLDRATTFYDAALAAIGAAPGVRDAKGRVVYTCGAEHFMVTRPIDDHPASPANGGTVAFAAGGADQVDAWHSAGLANGGQAIEDPPGLRADTGLYLAYLRDPDGNKLCAVYEQRESQQRRVASA
jgi:catechol 2,3-dioxygenase-like lactoylglutathione lyase family enzyme